MTAEVYVLDQVGYDVRGGNAEVYATLEAAQMAAPKVTWKQTSDTEWEEECAPGSIHDIYVIYRRPIIPALAVIPALDLDPAASVAPPDRARMERILETWAAPWLVVDAAPESGEGWVTVRGCMNGVRAGKLHRLPATGLTTFQLRPLSAERYGPNVHGCELSVNGRVVVRAATSGPFAADSPMPDARETRLAFEQWNYAHDELSVTVNGWDE